MRKSWLIIVLLGLAVGGSLQLLTAAEMLPAPFKEITRARIVSLKQVDELMAKQFQFSFKDKSLREVTYLLKERTGLECLIDSRVNPDQQLSLESGFTDVAGILDQLSQQANCKWCLTGDVLYFTNEETAKLLPVLCKWKKSELNQLKLNSKQIAGWETPTVFQWEFLSAPRELCLIIAENSGVKISNPELIPHDLRDAGEIQQLSPLEQLQLLLACYRLTWKWISKNEMLLIPVDMQQEVSLEYPFSKVEQKQIVAKLKNKAGVKIKELSKQIMIEGTLKDQMDCLAEIEAFKGESKPVAANQALLANRRFTLKVMDAKAIDVLTALKGGGIKILMDADLLAAKGIDFENRVSFEVKNVTLSELLDKILINNKVSYKIEQESVLIIPQ